MAEAEPPRETPGAPVTMGLPPGYDALAEAKRLLRQIRSGALATLASGTGHPFATLVSVATDFDGSPILLTSALSTHSVNLVVDPRASILLAEGGRGDPLAHPRLTIVGRAARAEDPGLRARLRARFLARHPKSALYADFGDFSFWRVGIEAAHLNGGFGKAADFQGTAVVTALEDAQSLVAVEADAVAHMNGDHAEALQLYATRLAGESEGQWCATGLDPEGLDLAWGDRTARVAFPRRVTDPAELRKLLVELAAIARGTGAAAS
jgi:heme iron utilization protein